MAGYSERFDQDAEARAEAWAERLAAQLPPFTPEEAREVGRIAATIDARRAEKDRQAQASTKAAA